MFMKSDDPSDNLADLERYAQRMLRAGAERLDGRTRSKLTQARFAALDAVRDRREGAMLSPGTALWTGWRTWLMPVGSVAAAAVVALLFHFRGAGGGMSPSPLEEEVVTSGENLEMMEDLDFYEWVGSQPAEEAKDAGGDAV